MNGFLDIRCQQVQVFRGLRSGNQDTAFDGNLGAGSSFKSL